MLKILIKEKLKKKERVTITSQLPNKIKDNSVFWHYSHYYFPVLPYPYFLVIPCCGVDNIRYKQHHTLLRTVILLIDLLQSTPCLQ